MHHSCTTATRTVQQWVADHPDALAEVRFVLFGEGDFEVYKGLLG